MIRKAYSKTGDSCRVTFQISAEEAAAQSAAILGDFNDWQLRSHPLDRQQDGSFRLTVALPAGRDYRFRYLLDEERWQNDTGADDYRFNQYGSQDSIVDLSTKPAAAAKQPQAAKAVTARPAKPAKASRAKAAPRRPGGATPE